MKSPRQLFLVIAASAFLPAYGEVLKSGPFIGLDLDRVAVELRPIIVAANDDCIEVDEYRLPKHAEPCPVEIKDGGSREFFGNGYVILVRRSIADLVEINTILGCSYGYELYLGTSSRSTENIRPRPLVSKVWYVSLEKLRAVSAANYESLKARMPPLEKYYQLRPKADAEKGKKEESNQLPLPTPMAVTRMALR